MSRAAQARLALRTFVDSVDDNTDLTNEQIDERIAMLTADVTRAESLDQARALAGDAEPVETRDAITAPEQETRVSQVTTRTIDVDKNIDDFVKRGAHLGDRISVRAVLTTANTWAGDPNPSKKDLGVQPTIEADLPFLSLFPSMSMDEDTVSYAREVLKPNAAKEVAEGTLKPEQAFEMEEVSHRLHTVAAWITVTRQGLRSRSYLRSMIENRLTANVRARINTQVYAGDGVTPNIEGLLNAGIQVIDAGKGTDGKGIHRTIRAAVYHLADTPEAPAATHYVINPLDAQDYDDYLDETPRGLNIGLTRLVSSAQPQGSVLVGALRNPAVLQVLYRDGMEVFASREHAENLTHNLVTLLGEQEASLAVYRPSAIVQANFTAVETD